MVRIHRRGAKKKLTEAGRYWAGEKVVDETADDLRAMGAPAEIIAKAEAGALEKPFEVFPENWTAVRVFLAASTQWNAAGMGGPVGLNYTSLEFLFKIYKVKNPLKTFRKIQIIESAVLTALRERGEKK